MADDVTRPSPRLVAGLWCSEVLEALPDLIEGELDAARLAQVSAHVAACDWCERFGGIYGTLVKTLRTGSALAPDGLAERLAVKLNEVIEEER